MALPESYSYRKTIHFNKFWSLLLKKRYRHMEQNNAESRIICS